jgi:hypothetical protein
VGTFLYAPGIKVYIGTEKNGTLDVSDDLTQWDMTRRSDGVSTFDFTLQNTRRKYDGILTPNDRVAVVMKRLTWVRTFTGYLNSVPLATAWPQAVDITSSCSLKRLQYWYWDSYVSYSQALIMRALGVRTANGQAVTNDGNITNVILSILQEVVGWPSSKVHISQIPRNWFDIAFKIATSVDQLTQVADQIANQYAQQLGAGGSVGGTAGVSGNATGTNVHLPDGTYGGYSITSDQCRNCEAIYQAGVIEGMTKRDIAVGIMTARQESTLHNTDKGDSAGPDSRGIFQQRTNWGSLAERMNPLSSARIFFRAMKQKYPNAAARQSVDPGTMSLRIQVYRSDLVSLYTRYWAMANAAVAAMAPVASTNTATGGAVSAQTAAALAKAKADQQSADLARKKTTADLLAVGEALWKAYPNIPYSQSAQDYKSAHPSALDCSLFIKWCYFHVTGKSDIPRTATAQYYWAIANGGKKISVAEAYKTPGACVFVLGEHVELTKGDGKTTTGSHGTGIRNGDASTPQSYWNAACILPNLVGSSATTGGAASPTGTATAGVQVGQYQQSPEYNPNDPFDALFGNNPWVPIPSTDTNFVMANALGGVRALMNDQPLLPYLKNLFTSTMRSFCSAPNGDLIAWFPDYYGIWGTAAKMVLEPIELQNFTVQWSDDFLVTHQFTTTGAQGGYTQVDLSNGTADAAMVNMRQVYTVGIVTIEIPAVLYALLGVKADDQSARNFTQWVLKRFGARPNYQQMSSLNGLKAEFFSAMYIFMQNWAYQYNASVPMTFMPELFPGMLIQIPAFDFQAYVTQVTHSGRYGGSGGFTTAVNIAAPARLPKSQTDKNNVLIGLPLAGGYNPTFQAESTSDFLDPAKSVSSTNAAEPQKTIGG